jgi:putative membrane protein
MFTSPEKSAARCARVFSRTLMAAGLILALAALPAGAQGVGGRSTDSGTGSTSSGSAAGAPGVMSGTATGTPLAREDTSLLTDLAQANIAEIESARMALEKSRNPEVRKFAQQMIDDHTTALDELRTLAQNKGFTLPEETDLQHKTLATALRILSGDTFDSQYMKRAGVNDHERTLTLLQKTQRSAKDADLKTLAAKMLPTVQSHLQMARQISTTAGAGKGDSR